MHIESEIFITDLPEECIKECSAQGSVDEAVAYWVADLDFTVGRHKATDYLVDCGAWTREELKELPDVEIAEKILWLACCEFNKYEDQKIVGIHSGMFSLDT